MVNRLTHPESSLSLFVRPLRQEETPNQRIARLEKALLDIPQAETVLTHDFQPGVYLRTLFMPASQIPGAPMVCIGHEHKGEHFNIVHRGRCLVSMDGELHTVEAPCMFRSLPGVRKVLWIQEDTLWTTIHANADDERDIEKLEARYVVKSAGWLEYHAEVARLKEEARKKELIETL